MQKTTVAACRSCLCQRIRFLFLPCYLIVFAGYAKGHPLDSPTIVKRQDATSSFNWWPYPPWGQSTSSSPTTLATSMQIVSSLAAVASDVTATTATLTTATVSTFTTAAPATVSPSFIRITALPPASSESSVSLRRAHARQSKSTRGGGFDIAHLAPVFGILAAVVGAAFAWVIHEYWITGRVHSSESRESTLLPGPPYGPPPRFRDTVSGTRPSFVDDGEDEREVDALNSPKLDGGNSRIRNWFGRSTRRVKTPSNHRESTQPHDSTAIKLSVPVAMEDEPFLCSVGRTALAADNGTASTSSSSDEHCQADDAVLYEATRGKSIKRTILDRFKFGRSKASYERGKTTDDDAVINDRAGNATSPGSVHHRIGHRRTNTDGQVMPLTGTPAPSRRPTGSSTMSQQIQSPPGFRVPVEDPISGALHNEDVDFARAASSSSRRSHQDSDKYTRVPARRSPYSSTPPRITPERGGARTSPSVYSSVTTTPVMPRFARPAMNRYESSILLSSPPMITSPALESQLFFGSTVSSRPPQLPEISALRAGKPQRSTDISAPPVRSDVREHRKLKTSRPPPLLPFPSSADSSPFRNRLKKSPPRIPPLPSQAWRADSSDSMDTVSDSFTTAPSGSPEKGPVGKTTPAERFHARHAALEKVEAILASSWSARDATRTDSPFLGPVLSIDPTKEPDGSDGAWGEIDLRDALKGTGIEQRLDVLKR